MSNKQARAKKKNPPIDADQLKPWLVGASIEDVHYDDHVLALTLGNGYIMICYTDLIGQAHKK